MLAASYAIRFDQAMETDRLVAIMGGEPKELQALFDDVEYRVVDEDDDNPATSITFMADWVEAHGFSAERG